MQLSEKIKILYSDITDADFGIRGTIKLQNDSDGNGDYIKSWEHKNPQPTVEQLKMIGE